jgi:DNA-binding NtrC family response regulator
MYGKDLVADFGPRGMPGPVLVADSDATFTNAVCEHLRQRGLRTTLASTAYSARATLWSDAPPVVVLGEFGSSQSDILEIIEEARRLPYDCSVIFVPRLSSEDLAIAAFRAGIREYLRRSACADALMPCVERCLRLQFKGAEHTPIDRDNAELARFIGCSQPVSAMKQFLLKVSKTDSSILITGETGTGKELVAQLIHTLSPRRDRPLVCINCAALPDNLLESELFGYERGAFTGANKAYPGRLQLAAGGTVMLDEIGEMTPYAQAKLLRAIESREVMPLGGRKTVPINVRIVAATNQEPEVLMRERRFRSDLYFRLNVARVHLVPLRERKEDVIPLFEHQVEEFSRRHGMHTSGVSQAAWECLLHYDWPGNVRELRNVVEAIFIDPPQGEIKIDHLPGPIRQRGTPPHSEETERERLLAALTATRWNKSNAARQLQWSRMTLYRKMTKYNLLQSRRARPLRKTLSRDE